MLGPLNPPVREGLPQHPPPGTPPQGLGCFMIESHQSTACRVSLVSVSESGSQKSKFLKVMLKILLKENKKKIRLFFAYVSEHLASFGTHFLLATIGDRGGRRAGGLHVVHPVTLNTLYIFVYRKKYRQLQKIRTRNRRPIEVLINVLKYYQTKQTILH